MLEEDLHYLLMVELSVIQVLWNIVRILNKKEKLKSLSLVELEQVNYFIVVKFIIIV